MLLASTRTSPNGHRQNHEKKVWPRREFVCLPFFPQLRFPLNGSILKRMRSASVFPTFLNGQIFHDWFFLWNQGVGANWPRICFTGSTCWLCRGSTFQTANPIFWVIEICHQPNWRLWNWHHPTSVWQCSFWKPWRDAEISWIAWSQWQKAGNCRGHTVYHGLNVILQRNHT